ncbi:MAG: hypothetical protein B7Y32_08690, partial [Methylophilales bacterium 16-45-7]
MIDCVCKLIRLSEVYMRCNKGWMFFIGVVLTVSLAGCASPEEKAKSYYEKGMSLLDSDPAKAKLEFQNALQM